MEVSALVRPEAATDAAAIRAVTVAAFANIKHSAPLVEGTGDPGEAALIEWLRADEGWIPELSLVAVLDDQIVGHCLTTRAHVADTPALGLGPLSVHPDHQGRGIGRELIRQTIVSAYGAGETLIGLLGDPGFYSKFAFIDAASVGVIAPDPQWGPHFQVLVLNAEHPRGPFRYAAPFARL